MTRTKTESPEEGRSPAAAEGAAPADALAGFHPAVRRWFSGRFEAPTAPQRRGWEAIRSGRHTLVSAPTGSGKTLAAFLGALDRLLREGVEAGGLPDETRVVYVSPLKALSADVHRNLGEPRKGIRQAARELGLEPPTITAAVRSGDTPRSRRRQMVRTPPHLLVTTPESLYLYLTAEKSRETLRTVDTVVVDEIHAVLESRRGAHLALSLERLREVCEGPLQRVGLSATQNPIEEVARFLVGTENVRGPASGPAEVPAEVPGAAGAGRGAGAEPGGPPSSGKGGDPSSPGEVDGDGGAAAAAVPGATDDGTADCVIVDEGHQQALDLGLEIPGSPLEAVLSSDARDEVCDRVADLIRAHRTTLVFVNTRREAERVAHALTGRLGEDRVTAHHGSLSKERRHDAERRLRDGQLDALVATASMELGIDVGYIDLVCQLGSPNRIATLVQRVGRSGHTVEGTPKGRVFPLTRDDLVQAAALLRTARAGGLDRVEILEAPLDILCQQIVAEVACGERPEGEMFRLARRAWPYRGLERETFDELVGMISRGVDTRRGRRGARIHHDAVNGVLKPRKGSRLAAITCGGAIPDNADYRVLKEPEGTFLGTVNEDFAIESLPGDVFQLGNTSWRLLKVETGVVRVEDAAGQPPNIPFWLGEAPARSAELSEAVSELRREVGERLGPVGDGHPPGGPGGAADGDGGRPDPGRDASDGLDRDGATEWLVSEAGLRRPAARQIADYLAESKRLLGELPTRDTLVLERFFDEGGGMQLVLHAPFGSRVNRAWGLALRKRFCRQFNFELQAAATEEGILLSLGPQHSFPLEDVFRYLGPDTVREVLVQALLDAPMFQTRWRWVATLSLALLRWRGGGKVAPQIQRMEAEDLLSAVFPDANACLETIAGDREVPDHPLVRQTIGDCLTDAMDLPRLRAILRRVHAGGFRLVARDTPEPSPLCHELVTARPYAFLDDGEAEERRTQAVRTRRAMEPSSARELGALDPEAVARVRREAWPEPESADDLHDALLTCGYLRPDEARGAGDGRPWRPWLEELAAERRAGEVVAPGTTEEGAGDPGGDGPGAGADGAGPIRLWVAAERLPEVRAVWPDAEVTPELTPPVGHASDPAGREEAVRELLRGRMDVSGPVTASGLAASLGVEAGDAERALLALENEGTVLRGHFTSPPDDVPPADDADGVEGRPVGRDGGPPAAGAAGARDGAAPAADDAGDPELEWCHRRLLSRIHRYTLKRLRAEVSPVSARDFMRFLFRWQRVGPGRRVRGSEGLAGVLEQLEGCELPAAAWEAEVLAARVEGSAPGDVDGLCTSGRVAWGRLSPPAAGSSGLRSSGPLRTSPVALWPRENTARWLEAAPDADELEPDAHARAVGGVLEERGASFFRELVDAAGLLPTQVERALGELAAFGLVTADSFSGLRALLLPSDERRALGGARGRRRGSSPPYGVDTAGRWSLLRPGGGDGSRPEGTEEAAGRDPEDVAGFHARVLLRRYGVVFRALLDREPLAPPWRVLLRALWRLEARGEIRGGRFVAGFSGEQFALPEAVGALRKARKEASSGELLVVSAADPLNLTGVVTPGDRIPARPSNRVGFRDGVPVCALAAGEVRSLDGEGPVGAAAERALVTRDVPPVLRPYVKTG